MAKPTKLATLLDKNARLAADLKLAQKREKTARGDVKLLWKNIEWLKQKNAELENLVPPLQAVATLEFTRPHPYFTTVPHDSELHQKLAGINSHSFEPYVRTFLEAGWKLKSTDVQPGLPGQGHTQVFTFTK